jgi:hypothetical protein
MPILELCKRQLKDGITVTDPALLKALPEVRSSVKVDYVYYSSIEMPTVFFVLGVWPSMDDYNTFAASAEKASKLAPLDKLSDAEWVEHAEFDSINSLPVKAPCMTITRAFLKGGDNPKEYYRKIGNVKDSIEEETKPHPCVFSWTVDTTPDLHKWLMFVGWQNKKHHQDYAAKLTKMSKEFPTIPDHYDAGTMHTHALNMEKDRPL